MSEAVAFTCDFCGTKEPELPADVAMGIPHSSVELVLRGGRLKPQGLQHPTPEEDGSERWTASLCDRCSKRFGALLDLRLLDPVEIERELRAQSLEAARYAETGSMHVPNGMRVTEPTHVRPIEKTAAAFWPSSIPAAPAAQFPNNPASIVQESPAAPEASSPKDPAPKKQRARTRKR